MYNDSSIQVISVSLKCFIHLTDSTIQSNYKLFIIHSVLLNLLLLFPRRLCTVDHLYQNCLFFLGEAELKMKNFLKQPRYERGKEFLPYLSFLSFMGNPAQNTRQDDPEYKACYGDIQPCIRIVSKRQWNVHSKETSDNC